MYTASESKTHPSFDVPLSSPTLSNIILTFGELIMMNSTTNSIESTIKSLDGTSSRSNERSTLQGVFTPTHLDLTSSIQGELILSKMISNLDIFQS